MTSIFTRRSLIRGLGIVLVGASLGSAAQAADCADVRESESFTVRTVQSRLMVAALTCDASDSYNAFVVRYRPDLTDHGYALKRYFKRTYGRASQRHMDRYVTDLANMASKLSNTDRAAFCARSKQDLAALLAAAKGDGERMLTEMVTPALATRDPAPACEMITRR